MNISEALATVLRALTGDPDVTPGLVERALVVLDERQEKALHAGPRLKGAAVYVAADRALGRTTDQPSGGES